MKKVCSKVYGCKVNQYETQALSEQLEHEGFSLTDNAKEADYVVINTCTVTKESDRELEYFVRKVRRDNHAAKIFLLGCYVDHHGPAAQTMDGIQGVLKNENKSSIAHMLKGIDAGTVDHRNNTSVQCGDPLAGITHFKGHTRAFIKVQDGCDRVCSYCIVRVIRGRSRSRERKEVLAEINRLAQAQYQEVVLTGVQLGAYGKDLQASCSLADLIDDIARIDAIQRIRISSIEPMDIDEALIACLRNNKKACNHLHMSLQSGDDDILRAMRRDYRRKDFIGLIKRLEREVPGFVYSTDIIVGFPGETEAAFQNTVDLVRTLPPMKIHVFPFSEREGTPACELTDKIPEKTKKRRVAEMLKVSEESFRVVAERMVGEIEPLLIEECTPHTGRVKVAGKLTTYLPVISYFKEKPSARIVNVKVVGLEGMSIIAEPVS